MHVLELVVTAVLLGQAPLKEAAPPAVGDWPQWHGPNRTNVSTETGLLKEWPKEGPPLLWKTEGLGHGVASVAVAAGRIYTLGYRGEDEFATALDAKDGKAVWTVRIGKAVPEMGIMRWLDQRTPTVDGDRLYAFTAFGELMCLETMSGTERWRKDYRKDFNGKTGTFGYGDYPLVDGDKLICVPGGETATMVALNKLTGELLWKCAVPGGDGAGHSATIVADAAGIRQYIAFLYKGVVGIAASDGKLLWRYDRIANRTANAYTPLVRGNQIFLSSGYNSGSALIELTADGAGIKVEERYLVQTSPQPWLGSVIASGDHVYLFRSNGGPLCVEWKTGMTAWGPVRGTGMGQAAVTAADGHLYVRYQDGKVVLVEITPEAYKEKSAFTIPPLGREPAWTFPVICGGWLYLRDQDVLYCYDVKGKQARRTRGPDAIFVSTPQDIVDKMLQLAEVKKEDVVYDLGCGDGRIVVTAAKKYGCRAVGIDIDPECVETARASVKKQEVGALVTIEEGNLFDRDLSGATVVALYLLPKLNVRLIPQLEKLPRGARIVSHEFDMPGVKPEKVVKVRSQEDDLEHTLYLWTTPLKKDN